MTRTSSGAGQELRPRRATRGDPDRRFAAATGPAGFAYVDVARAKEVVEKYADLQIGLADASIVVLAERHAVFEVLTLDQRHFRAMRIQRRKRFKILPLDR